MKHNSLFILASILISILSVSKASAVSSCSNLMGQCSYYECIQDEMNCSKDNYLTQFAKPYCHKYQNEQKNYSDRGQIFLTQVRYCLQEQIENMDSRRCDNIREYAVHSHIGCYLNSGFCELSLGEKMKIVLTAKKDLIHGDVRDAGLETMKLCNQSRFFTPFPGTY